MARERTLLLAGGTDGIGLAFLEAECQREKYSLIYVLGRDFRQVDGLRVGGGRVVNVVCDITDAGTMRQSLADAAINRVDDFVNTIGTFARGPVSGLTDEEVSSHFELNCVGNVNLIRAVLPLMLPQQGGGDDAAEAADGRAASAPELSDAGTGAQILVCTASLALEARSPYALQSATKAALKFFVDALRIELRGRVRVMSVLPPSSTLNTSWWYRSSIPWPPGAGCARTGCAMHSGRASAPLRAQWEAAVRRQIRGFQLAEFAALNTQAQRRHAHLRQGRRRARHVRVPAGLAGCRRDAVDARLPTRRVCSRAAAGAAPLRALKLVLTQTRRVSSGFYDLTRLSVVVYIGKFHLHNLLRLVVETHPVIFCADCSDSVCLDCIGAPQCVRVAGERCEMGSEMLSPPPLLRRLSQECAVCLPGLHRQEADDPLRRMQRLGVPRLHGQEAENLLWRL